MLETFKARLKALKADFKAQNLTNTRIDAFADRLHKKFPDLTEEADHDAKIKELNELNPFEDLAKQDDKVRNFEAKNKGQKTPEEIAEEKRLAEEEANKDMPAWAKSLMETVSSLKAEKETQTMQQRLAANEKLKGIDAKLYSKWQMPKSEEEIDAFADEVVSTYGHLIVKETDGVGGTSGTFIPGQQRIAGGTKKVDPDLLKYAERQNQKVVKDAKS